jgi:GntR family transcriptional regulator/MocR family aminotransferase
VGSFSKVLSPALRLGYVVAPPPLVPALLAARRAADLHPPAPTQGALVEFMLSGQLERHVRRMREAYRERHEALVAEARARLPGRLEIAPTDTGLHAVGWLPDGFAEGEAQARAARVGVDVLPLSRFGRVPGGRSGLLLGYGGCPPDVVRRGVAALAVALSRAGRAESR